MSSPRVRGGPGQSLTLGWRVAARCPALQAAKVLRVLPVGANLSAAVPTLLAQSGGQQQGAAKNKATTLSGHYYQQKFGENIASNAGPSLSSLADASTLKARMQALQQQLDQLHDFSAGLS